VLPVLHLGLAWYDDFVGIVVHATKSWRSAARWTRSASCTTGGGDLRRGDGPRAVMLSWVDVAGARESAHEGLQRRDPRVHPQDRHARRPRGRVPAAAVGAARRAWLETMQREFEAFREKAIVAERFGGAQTWLDPYGASGVDEFFAVACEAYFVAPERFREEHAALAQLFDGFFGARS